ncbi:hypothetical protein Tcan_01837 [Toxocara canis]|uniref:Uncharacterized protein n=1 Tax=Toxocara canis TaxID=6265 RepID=A0A0B2W6A5_TOXCA|nr:hypothetical protein Tcan_01837 [Toxocara canis]
MAVRTENVQMQKGSIAFKEGSLIRKLERAWYYIHGNAVIVYFRSFKVRLLQLRQETAWAEDLRD